MLADSEGAAYDTGMRRRIAILVAFFVLGGYALIAQTLLLRETQVILFGSELSWGLVLAFWLAGVAIGAMPIRLRERKARPGQPLLNFALPALMLPGMLFGEIEAVLFSRIVFHVGTGEYVGPGTMVLIAAACVTPIGLLVGTTFPAASALLARDGDVAAEKARAVGGVYLVESAGSLIGGILFTFLLVDRVARIPLVVGGGAILALAVAAVVYFHAPRRWVALAPLAVALAMAAYLGAGGASLAEQAGVALRWLASAPPGMELIRSEDTRYQNLALGRLDGQYSLYANGLVAATWPNPQDAAVEAHLDACECPSPQRILVLGGGADGLLKELQRYKPARLDYVTLDPQLFALVRPYLAEPDGQALDQLSGNVHFTDVRRFVMRAAASGGGPYDLVVLAAPEPASTLEARLYTQEFFGELAAIMSDDGVLAFSLHGSVGYWSAEPAEYVGSIVLALERVFPDVLLTFGEPTRCFAAKRKGVLTDSGEELARRYRAAGIESPYFDPLWFAGASDLLDPDKRATVTRALATYPPAFLNTDGRPAAALYHMRFWLQTAAAGHEGEGAPAGTRFDILGMLMQLRFDWVMAAAVGATALAALAGLVRGRGGFRRTALYWSVGTTGFATMALEIILLYTFQTLYGYVYSMVGLVVGVFMFGLVLGSLAMNRRLRAGGTRSRLPGMRGLVALDMAVTVFAAGLVIVLGALRGSAADWPVQVVTFALVAVSGILGGLLFPLAAAIALEDRATSTARAAGWVDAADNAGACLGALVTGVLLVPILGVSGACLAVAGLKALSALVVGVAASTSRPAASALPSPSA